MLPTYKPAMSFRTALVLPAATALILCAAAGALAQDFSCQITAPRPARAFFPGEAIFLTVTVNGPAQHATYFSYDYEGRQRIVDTLDVGENKPRRL